MLTTLGSTAAATFGQSTVCPGRGPATEGAALTPVGEGEADVDAVPDAEPDVEEVAPGCSPLPPRVALQPVDAAPTSTATSPAAS
jgi:hypothetical protein